MLRIKYNLKNFILTFILIILISFSNLSGLAGQENNSDKTSTNCKIESSKLICYNLQLNNKFKVILLNDPPRVHLKFDYDLIFYNKSLENDKVIKNIRLNKRLKKGSILAVELDKPAIISHITYNKNNIDNTIDLQLQFSKTSVTNFAIAKYILLKNGGNILSLSKEINSSKGKKFFKPNIKLLPNGEHKTVKNSNLKKKYNVFIDPGHGGRDPGAIGQSGTLEKNITLKTSVLLAKALQKNQKINPILSRNKDIYLTLKQRTNLAKINNADIFISIHADSSKNKKAKGISVFSLSDKASDLEAKMLAKRENEVDKFLGNKNQIKDPIIYNTLIKMFQRQAMNDSSHLARNILLNLEKTKLAVNRGHRFAGFSVLKSYDIPSVLIEIGFLSNKQEEKKLSNTKYLEELSNGLAVAIVNYFNAYKE